MITEYHRPTTLDDATALSALPDAVIVGGGTVVTANPGSNATVAVDLQSLALDRVNSDGDDVHIGEIGRAHV